MVIVCGVLTGLNKGAFSDCTGLTSVIISDSVTSIGEYAFYYCTGLTSVTIPDSVKGIGEDAFMFCSNLTEIHYNGDLTGWLNISGLGNLMRYGKYTKTLYIGGTKIEGDLVIPDSVTSIGEYVFYYCTDLTSVTIGSGVTNIDSDAFYNCTGLTSIIVKEGNSRYIAKDNCLIDTRTATLVLGCKTSVIPNDGSVTRIGEDAFSDCTGLTSVIISDSVTSIGEYAFYYCTGLTSVTIPDSVTSIGWGAFKNCSGLKRIDFNGTKAQWNAIKKDYFWSYNTGNFTVYCTDGTLSKSEA